MNTWSPAGSSVLRGHGTFTDGTLMEEVGHSLDSMHMCMSIPMSVWKPEFDGECCPRSLSTLYTEAGSLTGTQIWMSDLVIY